MPADTSQTRESEPPRARLAVGVLLTTPLVVVGMLPAAQFDGWEWLALGLATPVVAWMAGLSIGRRRATRGIGR